MFKFCIIFIIIIFFLTLKNQRERFQAVGLNPIKPLYNADLKLTFKQGQQSMLVIFGKKSIVITLILEIMNKESSKFFSQVAHVTVVTEVFNHLL